MIDFMRNRWFFGGKAGSVYPKQYSKVPIRKQGCRKWKRSRKQVPGALFVGCYFFSSSTIFALDAYVLDSVSII